MHTVIRTTIQTLKQPKDLNVSLASLENNNYRLGNGN